MTKRKSDAAEILVGHHLGPHVSQSALAYSLQYVRDHGLPSASSRPTQLRARVSTVEAMGTRYGPIVVPVSLPLVVDGNNIEEQVFMINPLAMLWRTLHDCLPFADLFRHAANSHSLARPWRLVIYFDEVSPSTDISGGVDGREMQCIYWTFAEFGNRLYSEDVWLVLAAVRSDLVNNKMPGGMSRLVAMALRMFFSPDSHDASKSGVALMVKEADAEHTKCRLYIAHHATIADFKALCQVLGSNSQAGTKPCPECRQIIDPWKSKDAALEGPGLVPFTSTQPRTWRKHDDDSVRRLMAKLRDAPRARYKALTMIHGYKYCEHHVINDHYLMYKPISTLLYDWQHIWCVGGVFGRSLDACLDSIKGLAGVADFDAQFKKWVWPRQFPSARAIFATGRFLADASLTLSCATVMMRYLRDVLLPIANDSQRLAITSHILACECVMLLNTRSCTPDELEEATVNFAEAHTAAHGHAYWVFKFHQALDLPGQFRRFLRDPSESRVFLPNCWCLERKHKIVKRHSHDHRNTKGLERAVADNIVIDHMHHWQNEFLHEGLRNPHQPNASIRNTLLELYPDAVDIQVSKVYVTRHGQEFHDKDFVFTADGDGFIWYFFQTSISELYTVFQQCEMMRCDRARKIATYRVRGDPKVVPCSALHRAGTYKLNEEKLIVLMA